MALADSVQYDEFPEFGIPEEILMENAGRAAFGDAYDAVVSKMPAWAQQAHPDWMVLRGMAEATTSVVNGVNQSWDIPNLFIPDGASFTSNKPRSLPPAPRSRPAA